MPIINELKLLPTCHSVAVAISKGSWGNGVACHFVPASFLQISTALCLLVMAVLFLVSDPITTVDKKRVLTTVGGENMASRSSWD